MWRWVGVVTLAGCSQVFGLEPPVLLDADHACSTASLECVTADVLRSCSGQGAAPIDTTCAWGCLEPAHCARISPAGGAVNRDDVAGTTALN